MPRSKSKLKSHKRRSDAVLPTVPRSVVTDDLVSASYRFVGSGSTGATISVTRGTLLSLLGLATSTTNAYRVIGAIRLRTVHVWNNPSSTGATSNTSFSWSAIDTRPSTQISTSLGTAAGTYMRYVPPSHSLAGMWSIADVNESDSLFNFTFSPYDTIQLDVTYQLQNGVNSAFSPTSITSSGMSVGFIYSFSLDRGGKLLSQGRLSVT
jgi:hypothetical protein